jgi:hypothetical protein
MSGCPRVLTEDKLLDISNLMLQSLGKSVRKLAQQTRLYHMVVLIWLFKTFKTASVQDYRNARAENNSALLHMLHYSDGAWFHMSGYVNSKNTL